MGQKTVDLGTELTDTALQAGLRKINERWAATCGEKRA